jgi:5-methylthioadenosine/S-adenosylhomocysteine deaminase
MQLKLKAHFFFFFPFLPNITVSQLLEMATINGAKALGIDHLVGSLVKGKMADLIAIELKTEPVYNPIINLAFTGTNR